ncbi:MAG: phosphoribosylformylglycinamidine synthase [Chloroflexi bacterium HGW-Chloroflexi-1]|nr:MAG: phosphoribosylformylglycinamidine synthase [Chloroflexi bacterium HGW-Chloroflexi-1]
MIYRVEVSTKPGSRDARGESIQRQAAALGVQEVQAVSVADLYFLEGDPDDAAVQHLTAALLCDPVVEDAHIERLPAPEITKSIDNPQSETCAEPSRSIANRKSVEVLLRPGVTDSVAESLLEGARMIGEHRLQRAAAARRYVISGDLPDSDVRRIAEGLLANGVIQTYAIDRPAAPPFVPAQPADATVEVIPLAGADDATLEAISHARRLALDLAEMAAIQDYYRGEGREPTDVELEMLAQTWSEHCVHKTFKALIDYEELDADGAAIPGTQRQIDSLLNTCIRAATEAVNKPWVHSAFVDNAGIIAFDDRLDLAFKVETHNHPSALEPFGGANTGVGGVIRDVIGVSARPIANTDVLCFGPPALPFADLPAGVLHPRRIAAGVTAGIEDYGNKMGIPTVNGAILYDPRYTANPLVFCGCLGVLPHGSHRNQPQTGDLAVVVGGRTGRDGLRGATFSSMEMTHETGQVAGSAVQIGHPIHEKQALEVVLVARDEGLYTAITDCGAGGLSSAVGEMAAELGAEIHLERAPLKYPGLRPWEIWLSEAQERMVLAVPPASWPRLQAICAELDVEATALGAFTGDGRLTLHYDGRVVGQLSTDFLHNGIPRRVLHAVWQRPDPPTPFPLREGGDTLSHVGESGTPMTQVATLQDAPPHVGEGLGERSLLALLAMPDIRSKEDVVRRYDHEVQAGTVVKPFVGRADAGPSDAAVLDLRFAICDFGSQDGPATRNHQSAIRNPQSAIGNRGVALACGINPHYGAIDPYAMAWAAVDEALRNCVAVGADPDQVALLDNFCWGNPTLPDRLGGLVRCAQGCYDAAVAYGAPFISGKDSLNNEYTAADGRKHAIPGTLLISALGSVPDVKRTVTMDLKAPGDLLYIVGETREELGGSSYARLYSLPLAGGGPGWGFVPQPPARAIETYRALHRAITDGLVRACHDCSEGGLAVAAAEMSLAGGLGLDLRLADVPRAPGLNRDAALAFSESLGRLIVSVAPADALAFEAHLAGLPWACAGAVRDDDRLRVSGMDGVPVIETDLSALRHAWQGHLGMDFGPGGARNE